MRTLLIGLAALVLLFLLWRAKRQPQSTSSAASGQVAPGSVAPASRDDFLSGSCTRWRGPCDSRPPASLPPPPQFLGVEPAAPAIDAVENVLDKFRRLVAAGYTQAQINAILSGEALEA